MTTAPSFVKPAFRIAGQSLVASIACCIAWWFWELSRHGLPMAVLFAAPFALSGAFHLSKALFEIVKLILRHRKWARYQARGAKPKADRLAAEADLKRKGLIR